jgi:hypothetical protein
VRIEVGVASYNVFEIEICRRRVFTCLYRLQASCARGAYIDTGAMFNFFLFLCYFYFAGCCCVLRLLWGIGLRSVGLGLLPVYVVCRLAAHVIFLFLRGLCWIGLYMTVCGCL